jgi:uncharacterized protein with WD repeat
MRSYLLNIVVAGPALVALSSDRCLAESSLPRATLTGHTEGVWPVAFSPDGKTLASGSKDTTVRLWDVKTAKNTATLLTGHTDAIVSLSFSPAGKTLAVGSQDNDITLWDAAGGKRTATLRGHTSYVWSLAFSPSGKTLASASSDNTLKLWDVPGEKNTATIKVPGRGLDSVVFSPDGKMVATGGRDGSIRLWDVATGRNTATLEGRIGQIYCVAFSPDRKMLAAGGDKNVELWNVASRSNVALLKGHTNWVFSVAFSPDGTMLASGSEDKSVKLWDRAAAIKADVPLPKPSPLRPALPPARPVAQETSPRPADVLIRWLRIHEAWGLPRPRPLESLALIERFVLFLSDFAGPERKRGQFVFPWQSKVECLAHFALTGDAYGCEKILKVSRDGKARAEVVLRRYFEPRKKAEDRLRDLERQTAALTPDASGLGRKDLERRNLVRLKEEEGYWGSVVKARVKEEQAFALVYGLLRAIRTGPINTGTAPLKGKK